MEQDVCSRPSKVPHHLRPFQRPSLIVEPELTADNNFALQTSPPQSVELCPRHWRLPPKRSLRNTLKDILLKEWPRPSPRTPPRSRSHDRPSMMQMKYSDDYITARAANPRTGLISPSVGTLTPRLPETPDSPGEALHIQEKQILPSPTPDNKGKPGLKRVNESRKINSNTRKLWKADEDGWLMDGSANTASPRATATEVEGSLVSSGPQPLLNEDALIIHMPSAQEPQPYAYPGYSTEQIEAAEFYKRKARRVSSEGYDKRLLQSTRQVSSGPRPGVSGIRKVSSSKLGQNVPLRKVSHSGNADSPVFHGGHITVAKRRLAPQEFHDIETLDCHGGAELHAAMFAPFSSPKTPAMRARDGVVTEMQTAQASRHHDISARHHIRRKPIDGNQKESSYGTHDLKDLPHIALVHPALTALPQTHPQRQRMQEGARTCSLGCARDTNEGFCMERRTPSHDVGSFSSHSLFDQRAADPDVDRTDPRGTYLDHLVNDENSPKLFELLAGALVTLTEASQHAIAPVIPRIRLIEVLRAEDRTTQQKRDALKPLITTVGQALIILSITVILWHVGSAVAHVFEIVFWPVIVPFRVLKWIGGGRG